MPDPFEEFEHWAEGRPVSALPVEEVRRRGDRMRRRRTGLQAFGAAAALAVVMAGGSVLTAQSTDSGPRPAPATEAPRPAGDWLHAIPAGFPLDERLPAVEGGDAERRTVEDPTPPWDDRIACRPIDAGDRSDARAAYVSGERVRESRELALFADESAAHAELESLRQAAVDCEDRSFLGESAVGRFSVAPAGRGVLLQMLSYDGQRRVPGRHAAVLSQVGNAVLMVSLRDDSTAVRPTDEAGNRLLQRAKSLAGDMCVFAAGGCPTSAPDEPVSPPAPVPSGDPVTTIPAGTRLDVGLPQPDAESTRTTVRDPSTRLAFDPCHVSGDHVIGLPPVDFLGVTQLFPAGGAVRQLAVFPDERAAVTAMTRLRADLGRCSRYEYPDGVSEDRWTELGSDAATFGVDDALVAVSHSLTDGLPTTGASHHLVLRTGNAVLAMVYDGEFGGSPEDRAVFDVDAKQRDDAARILPQLCVFADEGCGG